MISLADSTMQTVVQRGEIRPNTTNNMQVKHFYFNTDQLPSHNCIFGRASGKVNGPDFNSCSITTYYSLHLN